MTTLLIGSSTSALKGQRLLARHGIRSGLRRISRPGKQGCGYSLVLPSRGAEAAELLEQVGIPVLSSRTEQEGPP